MDSDISFQTYLNPLDNYDARAHNSKMCFCNVGRGIRRIYRHNKDIYEMRVQLVIARNAARKRGEDPWVVTDDIPDKLTDIRSNRYGRILDRLIWKKQFARGLRDFVYILYKRK